MIAASGGAYRYAAGAVMAFYASSTAIFPARLSKY
jgi:hypothetical protein